MENKCEGCKWDGHECDMCDTCCRAYNDEFEREPEPEKLYWLWGCRRPDTAWVAMEFLDEESKKTSGEYSGLERDKMIRKLHIPGVSPINSAGEYVAQPMEEK